ncbi:MAG: YfjI family protein, partial [Limnohabitans sp.]|nr:YfjI family protein [Limnohabitans sp.]
SNSVESILERHDYTWHPREQRWSPPTATGAPGVRPIPGRDGLWQSDHASDPLTGTFDAWIAHVVLDRFGDMEAAKQAMDKERLSPAQDFIALIDPETGEIGVANATPSDKPAVGHVLPHISEVAVWSEGASQAVPAHLLDLPHPMLSQIAQLMDATAEDTDRAMTVLGVIHLASATVARRVISNKRNCAALYLCGVARTGRGKNAAKNFVAKALDRAFNQGVCSEFSSGSGIFSLMSLSPAAVMHLDEFGDKLGHGLRDRVGSPVAKGFSYLKEVFSQADDRISPAAFSLVSLTAKQRKDFLESNKPIQMPHLNILAVTTPGQLGDAVTDASVEGGLINRFLFVEACGQLLENKQFDATPPEWLLRHMRSARGLDDGGNLTLESLEPGLPEQVPDLREYVFCSASMAALDAYKAEIRRLVANDEFLADMSQRWREIAMRMALSLHAFSEPGIQTIDPAITIWAIDYTRHYGRSFARKLLSMAQPSESYGRRRKAYLEAFRGRPEGTTTHDMGRMAPWRNDSPLLRGQIIKDMLASGDITQVWVDKPARGPAPKVIVALA